MNFSLPKLSKAELFSFAKVMEMQVLLRRNYSDENIAAKQHRIILLHLRSRIKAIDIDSELEQIQKLASSGICPSGERIKEFIAACVAKGEIDSHMDNLLLCLIDICKLEEENAYDSSTELREALVIVDSVI